MKDQRAAAGGGACELQRSGHRTSPLIKLATAEAHALALPIFEKDEGGLVWILPERIDQDFRYRSISAIGNGTGT